MLITEATRVMLRSVRCEFEERPPMPMRGKRRTVRLWAPVVPDVDATRVTAGARGVQRASVGD
jgi:class 3 adenylate cyclase